mmetsp:Transcript_63974/g.187132  ORF Transcript_63974/g.187132 Transcript_63974/m.187132 type:complete len:201 (+) Transcript_63974:153-755(+)
MDSELRMQGIPAHLLADGEVGHDLFTPTQYGRILVCLLEAFDVLPHPGPCDPTAAKHLHRLICNQGARARGLVLQESNWAPQLLRLLLVGHDIHLVCHNLQESMSTLNHPCHPCQLMTQHRLLNEGFAEGLALRCPLEAIGNLQPACRKKLRHNEPALMVEVVHDTSKALAFLPTVPQSHKVLHWHLDVVKEHQSCASTT